MKKYLLRGGIVGLIVTAIVLVVVELSTKCSGYYSGLRLPEKAFLADAFVIYGLFVAGGIIAGVILGWIIVKIRG